MSCIRLLYKRSFIAVLHCHPDTLVINRKENKQKEGMKEMNLMEAVHYAEYLQHFPPYSFHNQKFQFF